jgi:hypothetical protein
MELSPDRHPSVIGKQFSWFAGAIPTQRRRGARLEQLENASEGFSPSQSELRSSVA